MDATASTVETAVSHLSCFNPGFFLEFHPATTGKLARKRHQPHIDFPEKPLPSPVSRRGSLFASAGVGPGASMRAL